MDCYRLNGQIILLHSTGLGTSREEDREKASQIYYKTYKACDQLKCNDYHIKLLNCVKLT